MSMLETLKILEKMKLMQPSSILELCHERLESTTKVKAWGEHGLFYNPHGVLKRGVYVMTIKEKDGANDKSSHLDREHVYRINTGIHKETFCKLFGSIPKRPVAGNIISLPYDFTQLDTILPHPVYGWMSWVCVLSPTKETFDTFFSYIHESYQLAQKKFEKRTRNIHEAK